MPLWSVEEWRARIGSSWAALGRQALHCSSHYSCSKQRRHYVQCCPALGGGGGGGGGLVATILPMMTTITLLVRSMSLIIVHPLEPGSSTNFHSGSRMCYQGNKGSVWSYMYISHLFLVLVLWNKLLSWIRAQQLVGDLLSRDLFESMNSVQPTTSNGYIVSTLAIAIVVAMSLETVAAVQASLLLRCGDIETNPGPLTREAEDDFHTVYSELVTVKAYYYQLGIGLGLPLGELMAIHKGSQDIELAFSDVLLSWLRHRYNVDRFGPPTWRKLVEAVDSQTNPALAAAIAARHPANSPSAAKRMRLSRPGSPSPTPCTSSGNNSSPLDRWRQLLIDFYLASRDLSDAWPPLKTIQFVQLALVEQKDSAQHIGLKTIREDIDAVYGHKTKTNLSDLFKDVKRSSLYLLEGRPGCGKTTLMIHVTNQWAKGESLTSQSIKLIFLVQLRRLNGREDIDLKDLLQAACSDFSNEDQKEIMDYINTKRGEGVMFVLDGFDEYAPGQNPENFISRLIMKKLFCRSIVTVSSRPAATQSFRRVASKYIEVVGFFKEQIKEYINCFFKQNREEERAQQLIQHLEQHPVLMNLCYLPLHCAMLVFLYDQGNATLPVTETEFYRDFTLSILIRSICKQSDSLDCPPKLKSFDCLPCDHRKIFDKICKLAFQATITSQQIFEKTELDQICSNDSLGLVVIDRYFVRYGIDETYTFLHLTLQEYLAAFHIAGLSESEQTYIVSRHCKDKHLHVTWRFLFGILDYSKESTVKLFKLILDATSDDCLLHIQCAYESQHSAACTDVLQHHKCGLNFTNIGPFDLACITYVLKTAEYTTIKLNFSDFRADNAVALLKGVGDHQLSLTVVWGEAVQSVLDALSLVTVPGLIELHLEADCDASVSVKSHLKLSSNLHKLILINIYVTNSGLEERFKHLPNLEELNIANASCPLTVLEAIKHCTNLVKLILGGNQFGDDGLQAVAEGIKNCRELKQLSLHNNSLTDKSIPHLTRLIKSARSLEKLVLQVNCFTQKGVQQIKQAVSKRNSVGDVTKLELLID